MATATVIFGAIFIGIAEAVFGRSTKPLTPQ
jgi:hypothetical protein